MLHVRVVLVESCFEESIGFVARAMKNFGLSDLHLVNPAVSLGSSCRKRAGHAQEILDSAKVHRFLPKALSGALTVGTTAQRSLSSKNLLRRHVTPKDLSGVLAGTEGIVAIVFGREGTGLTNLELGMCDVTVTIPATSGYPTLNISHAAAIIFYELFASTQERTPVELASEGVKAKILEFFGESAASTSLEEYRVGLAVRAFRNVLGRSAIRRREANLLTGALRRISEYSKRPLKTESGETFTNSPSSDLEASIDLA